MQRTIGYRLAISLMSAALLVSTGLRADDDALVEKCSTCHGKGGVSCDESIPSIAGLSSFVIEDNLFTFADKARPCRASVFEKVEDDDHCAMAGSLDEDQIAAVAEHFSKLDFSPASQEVDADAAARGEALHGADCEKCHSDGGANPEDDAGILAGQWIGYLRQAIADFKSEARPQPKSMKAKIDKLSDEDIEALLQYYGSRK